MDGYTVTPGKDHWGDDITSVGGVSSVYTAIAACNALPACVSCQYSGASMSYWLKSQASITTDYAEGCLYVKVAPSQSLRLVGGSTSSSGRLEVYLNGQWGTVCDDNWAESVVSYNAQTVCRQLGLPWEGAYARTVAYYGQNTGLPILMDDVACTGSGVSIQACQRRASGNDCSHSEDVGEFRLCTGG